MSHENPPTSAPAHENPPTPPVSGVGAEHPPVHHHTEADTVRVEELHQELDAEHTPHDHHEEGAHTGGHPHSQIETRTPKEALTHMWKGRGGFLWAVGKATTVVGAFFAWFRSMGWFKIDQVSGEHSGGGGHKKEDHGHGGGHGGGGHH